MHDLYVFIKDGMQFIRKPLKRSSYVLVLTYNQKKEKFDIGCSQLMQHLHDLQLQYQSYECAAPEYKGISIKQNWLSKDK